MSPAEERAEREGLPVLAVPTFDLVNAALGHPMIEKLLDGTEVLLRLATVDEVLEFQRSALETMPAGHRPPLMSRQQAAELVVPLNGGAS
jgi:hypothetical protein